MQPPTRATTRSVTTMVTAAILVLGLCSCADTRVRYEDSAVVTTPFTGVEIASNSGAVTVVAGSESVVERVVRHGGTDPGTSTWSVDGGVLVLRDCALPDCSIEYRVTVPAGLPVSGVSDSGALEVSAMGPIDLTSSSGEVVVRQSDDPVTVRSESGAVSIDGSSGRVSASAGSGSVSVVLSAPGDVRVVTSSGRVDLVVPQAAYRLVTTTDSGGTDSMVTDDPSASRTLDVRTGSGAIDIRY